MDKEFERVMNLVDRIAQGRDAVDRMNARKKQESKPNVCMDGKSNERFFEGYIYAFPSFDDGADNLYMLAVRINGKLWFVELTYGVIIDPSTYDVKEVLDIYAPKITHGLELDEAISDTSCRIYTKPVVKDITKEEIERILGFKINII